MIINEYSHLYLYAKGHYLKSDVIEDLRRICGPICGIDPWDMSIDDVMYWCLKVACKHMQEEKRDLLDIFRDFLGDISPDNCWRVGYYTKHASWAKERLTAPYIFEKAVIYKCLSIIMMVSVKEPKTGKILLALDEPDSNILPLNKKAKELQRV